MSTTAAEILKICDIHVNRINQGLKHVKHLFPIDEDTLQNISEQDLPWIDFLIFRFGKLQDIMGSKLIDIFLEQNQESFESLTVLDKVNKLEKLRIIDDSEVWKTMRRVRNHISFEYPDAPFLTVKYLNQIYELTPMLLNIYSNIKSKLVV